MWSRRADTSSKPCSHHYACTLLIRTIQNHSHSNMPVTFQRTYTFELAQQRRYNFRKRINMIPLSIFISRINTLQALQNLRLYSAINLLNAEPAILATAVVIYGNIWVWYFVWFRVKLKKGIT